MAKIAGHLRSFSESPLKLVIIVFVCTAFTDVLSALVVHYLLPGLSPFLHYILEATVLVVVLSPTLYYFQFRPMILHINRRAQTEKELRDAHEELEQRVLERTAKLKAVHDQLRNLAMHLQSVREDERERIAREIHDELGQVISAVKMKLSMLTRSLPESGENDKKCADQTKTAMQIVDTAIQTINRICMELHPSLLDYPGLAAAIEWEAKEFQKKSGIECEYIFSLDDIIADRTRSSSLFRIVQEALENVLRHSKATKVTITLMRHDENVVLEIVDNGVGVTEEQLSKTGSFGILTMREAVQALGGQLTISGIRDQGTTVITEIPIK